MKKMSWKNVKYKIKEHESLILLTIGVSGFLGAVVEAVRETPKALKMIEDEKRRMNDNLHEEEKVQSLPTKDVLRVTWKNYVPTAILIGLSATCLILAYSSDQKKKAAIVTACALSETTLQEFKDKILEMKGDKKSSEVFDSIAQDKMKEKPVETSEVYLTGKGETLCYDVISGRYFKSDIEKLRKIENEINKVMLYEGYVSLNDLYEMIGLDCIEIGEILGWRMEDDYIHMKFTSQLATDGTPCLVIDYQNGPKYDFRRFD